MSVIANNGLSEEEIEARVDHINTLRNGGKATEVIERFAMTSDGCSAARAFLEVNNEPIPGGLTGWEIVRKANDLMEGK